MNIYNPYTYYVGWSSLDKWYYGVRFAKGCDPSEFWVKYFTSSKEVKILREKFGEPDIIKLDKLFTDANEAREYEHKILKFLEADKNDKWLNKTCGKCPTSKGIKLTEEQKQNLSIIRKGRIFTKEHRENLSKGSKGVPKPKSEEHRRKLSEAAKGKKKSDEHKRKISESRKGKKLTDEHRNNISERHKNKKHTDEHRRKISEGQRKRWELIRNLKQIE
jgi:hypothetical protein